MPFTATHLTSDVGDSRRQLAHAEREPEAGDLPFFEGFIDLLGLINDILDLSKVEAGRMELLPEVVDLKQLIDVVVDQLKPLADKRGIQVVTVAMDSSSSVWTDHKRLRQVLTNLVSNAIKFTPEGQVAITLRRQEGPLPVMLIVEDTGIGIGPEELSKVFEPFHQVDSSMTRTVGGTGLGLAIVREIVGILGGTISVESAVGNGTCFTLALPERVPELGENDSIREQESDTSSFDVLESKRARRGREES